MLNCDIVMDKMIRQFGRTSIWEIISWRCSFSIISWIEILEGGMQLWDEILYSLSKTPHWSFICKILVKKRRKIPGISYVNITIHDSALASAKLTLSNSEIMDPVGLLILIENIDWSYPPVYRPHSPFCTILKRRIDRSAYDWSY